MKTLTLFVGIAIAAMLLVSCEDGPTGADPGQELNIIYDQGILKGLVFTKTADLIMSGDSVRITALPLQYDTLVNAEMRFDLTQIAVFNTPEITIRFLGGLPSTAGSFEWEPVTINVAGGNSVNVTTGVIIRYENILYYPVEGTTFVKEVRKDGNGNIIGMSGYFNGTLRALWPADFTPTPSEPVPPGYDISNPSLVGENLTAHSGVYYTRSRSSVRPSTGN